jgi:hypothetical protein
MNSVKPVVSIEVALAVLQVAVLSPSNPSQNLPHPHPHHPILDQHFVDAPLDTKTHDARAEAC